MIVIADFAVAAVGRLRDGARGSFAIAAVTHCVCVIGGMSPMPGMFIFTVTYQLPGRIGDASARDGPRESEGEQDDRADSGFHQSPC